MATRRITQLHCFGVQALDLTQHQLGVVSTAEALFVAVATTRIAMVGARSVTNHGQTPLYKKRTHDIVCTYHFIMMTFCVKFIQLPLMNPRLVDQPQSRLELRIATQYLTIGG